jgi:peptidylprolyl isomerase
MRTTVIIGVLGVAIAGCARSSVGRLPAVIPAVSGEVRDAFTLRYIDVQLGSGASVAPRGCVFAHYTGWLRNGTKFDSSRDTTPDGKPRTPIAFAQGARQVIPGWDAGFEGMRVGGKRRLFIPYQIAYGELGRPPVIPPKAELVFDVELMAVADTLARTVPTAPGRPAGPPPCPAWSAVSAASPGQ